MNNDNGSHSHLHGREHVMLRWLLGILILLVVFLLGLEIGKFHSGFGYRHFGPGMGYYGGYMMMRPPLGTFNSQVPAPVSNTQPQTNNANANKK